MVHQSMAAEPLKHGSPAMRWLSILASASLALALGFTLFFPIASRLTGDPYPSLLGIRQAIVLSESMAPALAAGDLIIIRTAPDYRVGDILTYVDQHGLVTHRLIATKEGNLLLQGDANRSPDKLVTPPQVLGKTVLRLPGIGRLAHWLRIRR